MMSKHDAVRPGYHPDVDTEKTASTLTFLQPLGSKSAGKEYCWAGDSWKLRSGYGKAMYFRCSLFEVNGLLEWRVLLQRIAQPRKCLFGHGAAYSRCQSQLHDAAGQAAFVC